MARSVGKSAKKRTTSGDNVQPIDDVSDSRVIRQNSIENSLKQRSKSVDNDKIKKKLLMTARYRLRKRRSTYLISDSSSMGNRNNCVSQLSDNCSEVKGHNNIDQDIVSSNKDSIQSSEEEKLSTRSNEDISKPFLQNVSVRLKSINFDTIDNDDEKYFPNSISDISDKLNTSLLDDFTDNSSLKKYNYPSILRLFSLLYTLFPSKLIDMRLIPFSYGDNGEIMTDYELISPFIFYYMEYNSFELSFYYQMLVLLFHSRICKIPQTCMNRLCVGYQAIVLHLKQCQLLKCKNVYCFSSRLVLHHIVTCKKPNCRFCPTLPKNAVRYCKDFVYGNENDNNFPLILRKSFSAPALSIKNEAISVNLARKIITNTFNDYAFIDKSFKNSLRNAMVTIDRSKTLHNLLQSINEHKVHMINPKDSLQRDLEKLESDIYLYSINKDAYHQSISVVSQILAFFSQIMLKLPFNPVDEINYIFENSSVNNQRNLSYGYENMYNFTPNSVCSPKMICDYFLPLVTSFCRSSEGQPFQVPVDPVFYMIYDYYDIIPYPMDLQTIITRLKECFYVDPWEPIHDIWQTINNAWLYNRRTTRFYKAATRLKELFIAKVSPIIKELGLCCPYRRVLTPQPLFCMGKDYCVIHRNAVYYIYQNYYIYCEQCFNDISGDAVSLPIQENNGDDNNDDSSIKKEQNVNLNDYQNQINSSNISDVKSHTTTKNKLISKSLFKKEVNCKVYMENFVECKKCGRRVHQVCKLHTSEINGIYFYCDKCTERMPKVPKINHYSSEYLATTPLSDFIEKWVNDMLTSKLEHHTQKVRIRMVYNNDKKLQTSKIINEYFRNKYPPEFTYCSKALFAFQMLDDGTEICFFGMHVQEYDERQPEPNCGKVYLSYLDSVHFFQPKILKTNVYFTILSAYFEYVRLRGFKYVYLWACPPCEGDDYIFHCHPTEQRVPKHKRLIEWYRKLLDECVRGKTFSKIKDLYRYITTEKNCEITHIPYFDGDYWPNAFEDVINDVNAEGNPKKTSVTTATSSNSMGRRRAMHMQNYDKDEVIVDNIDEDDEVSDCVTGDYNRASCAKNSKDISAHFISSSNRSNRFTKKKRYKKKSKFSYRKKPSSKKLEKKVSETIVQEFYTVEQRLHNLLKRFKDVFFVCKLNNNHMIVPQIKPSADPIIQCELTDGRSGFLQLCRERKWEFSTLLRTKYATLGLLIELHAQFGDRFVFTCNICKCHLFKKLNCTICTDFDLCYRCFYLYGHEHKMFEFNTADNKNNGSGGSSSISGGNKDIVTVSSNSNFKISSSSKNTLQAKNSPRNKAKNSMALSGSKESQIHSSFQSKYQQQVDNIIAAQELLDIMLHCSICPINDLKKPCRLNSRCQRMRIAIKHSTECTISSKRNCPICQSLITLCVPHAQLCKARDCRVVFCNLIRESISRKKLSFLKNDNVTNVNNKSALTVQKNNQQNYTVPPSRPIDFGDSSRNNANNTQSLPNLRQNANQGFPIFQFGESNQKLTASLPQSTIGKTETSISNKSFSSQQNSASCQNINRCSPLNQIEALNDERSNVLLPSSDGNNNIQTYGGYTSSSSLYKNNFQSNNSGHSTINSFNVHYYPTNNLNQSRRANVDVTKFPSNNNNNKLMEELTHSCFKENNATTNQSLTDWSSFQIATHGNTHLSSRNDIVATNNDICTINHIDNPSNTQLESQPYMQPTSSFPSTTTNLSEGSLPALSLCKTSELIYIKNIPIMMDPFSNPSISTEDIFLYNLKKLNDILELNEVSDDMLTQVLLYLKLFPYAMSYLTDNQQKKVIALLQTNRLGVTFNFYEKASIIFLFREKYNELVNKIKNQNILFGRHVEILSLVKQRHQTLSNSVWNVPKQFVIDVVNDVKAVDQTNENIPDKPYKTIISTKNLDDEVYDYSDFSFRLKYINSMAHNNVLKDQLNFYMKQLGCYQKSKVLKYVNNVVSSDSSNSKEKQNINKETINLKKCQLSSDLSKNVHNDGQTIPSLTLRSSPKKDIKFVYQHHKM